MPVILLNGTSSAGKTSIVKAIQKLSPIPFIHASVDAFTGMFEWTAIPKEMEEECDDAGVSIFHQALPALLSSRFPVIIDHVFVEEDWHQECYKRLRGHRVFSVGVHCPLEILQEREKRRGDRAIGLAERQFPLVHVHGPYDLEVDTFVASPEECAERILIAFNVGEPVMFTRAALLQQADDMLDEPMPPMERVKFEKLTAEQSVYACCGKQADFDSALFFWVKALEADGWSTGGLSILYPDRCYHVPLTEAEFFDLTQVGYEIPPLPWFLQPGGRFIRGMLMTSAGLDQSAVAEFDYGYVLFHWYSTA